MRADPLCVVGGLNKAQVFARRFMTKSARAKLSKKMYQPAPERKRSPGQIQAEAEKKKAA